MNDRRTPEWLPAALRPDAYIATTLKRTLIAHLSQAGLSTASKVLDIGCGSQPYRSAITAYGAEYVPCDLGPGPHVEIHPGVPLGLPERHFDIGLSVQVLEHVWDIDEYLGHFIRQLLPGGRLILSTHGVWIYHPHPGDFRRWTRAGLCRELESRGFVIEKVTPLLGPLAWSSQIRSLGMSLLLFRFGAVGALLSVAVSLTMNLRMRVEDLITPATITMDNPCVYVVTARRAGNASSS